MADEEKVVTTGTPDESTGTPAPEQDGGSDSDQDGGSAPELSEVEQLRQQVQDLERKQAQLLSEKSKGRGGYGHEQRTEPPTSDPRATQQPSPVERIAAEYEAAQRLWQETNDPAAKLAMSNLELLYEVAQRNQHEAAFARMKQEEETLARRYFATGEYRSPEAALKAARGDLYEQQRQDMDRQRETMQAEKDARERGVVATSVRSVTSAEHKKRTMSLADYQKVSDPDEKAALMRKVDDGKVVIDYGR